MVVALAGAAIVVAGIAGCSSKKSCSGGACVSGGNGTAKVTVDGKDQSVSGKVVCGTMENTVTMSVGDPTATSYAFNTIPGVPPPSASFAAPASRKARNARPRKSPYHWNPPAR